MTLSSNAHDEEAAEDQGRDWMEIHSRRCIQIPQIQVCICGFTWFWYQTIYSYCVHLPACTSWSILSLQQRGSLYCIGCHMCSHIRNCWLYSCLLLLSTNWVRNLMLTGCLFCGPLFLMFCFLNTVAIADTATAALPFGTIVVMVLIWTLATSPLLVLGGIAGKNSKAELQAPCHATKYPREIPPLPWYRGAIPQIAMAGFRPFSAIYIEVYYVFAWVHKIYTIYSILFIVFIILLIVTAFIMVALVYFQLAAEDHDWWWSSFLCGGSTGLFIYAYCLYYYFPGSDMSGFMQTSIFFGSMASISCGLFLMLGTVGFRTTLLFVRHIYWSIKCE